MEIVLNDAPNDDMHEVIINPLMAPDAGNGGLLELNDLQNIKEEVIQPGGQDLGFDLNAAPLAIQVQHLVDDLQIPHLNLPIEPVIDDEEIPFDMLMDEADFEAEAEENEQAEDAAAADGPEDHHWGLGGNNVLNVGAVLIRDQPPLDSALRSLNSHDVSFWITATNHIPGKKVKVSTQWAPFFTSMLLSPGNFKWAKSFIASEAWAFFNSGLKTSFIKVLDSGPSKPLLCLEDAPSDPDPSSPHQDF